MIAVPPLWWSIQLVGLPDIGEPFDVEAFRAFRIPDDRNAFVLYRQAADRLKPLDVSGKSKDEPIDLHARWSGADPDVRRWVEENREAMELFRRGTERPDALDPSGPLASRIRQLLGGLSTRSRSMALLEASRLEDAGRHGGGLGLVSRGPAGDRSLGVRGTVIERSVAGDRQGEIRRRLGSWAADPRTTPAMLRRALDDVVACGAIRPSESYTLKAELSEAGEPPRGPAQPGPRPAPLQAEACHLRFDGVPAGPGQMEAIVDAWRFWRREPERSRRVIRLAIANWLAYDDLPPDRRPAPDPERLRRVRLLCVRPRGAGQGPRPVARGPGPVAEHDERCPGIAPRWDPPGAPPQGAGQPPGAGGPPGERALPPRSRDRSALRRGAGRAVPQGTPRRRHGRRGTRTSIGAPAS